MNLTTIDLLRHGECSGGAIYRGRTDSELTELGVQQMEMSIAPFQPLPWSTIVSSPLCRCAYFSDRLAQRAGLPVEIDPRLAELDFGDWEGKSVESVWESDRQRVERFYQFYQHQFYQGEANEGDVKEGGGESELNDMVGEDHGIVESAPNGERVSLFRERVLEAWSDKITRFRGQHILLITHAGPIRMLLSELFKIPMAMTFNFNIGYASFSRIQVDVYSGQPHCSLIFLNGGGAR